MSLLSVSLGTAGALLALGTLCSRLRRQQRQRHNQAWQASLHSALALLQRVQKHRGLGGQDSQEARLQREQIATELDRLWRSCPQDDSGLAELDGAWRQLRQHPGLERGGGVVPRVGLLHAACAFRGVGPVQVGPVVTAHDLQGIGVEQ